ncbi:SacI homology domain-containing protein, partial [Piptocephalis cylindrospora]
RFYIVGEDEGANRFRILKVDRTTARAPELSVTEDEAIYTREGKDKLFGMIEMGAKSAGGLTRRLSFLGIIGFVSFLETHYLLVITKFSQVALIGGHYINHIDAVSMIPVDVSSAKGDRAAEEARYLDIFKGIDLTKNFYFSHTYDLTQSLQKNVDSSSMNPEKPREWHEMYAWNFHLLQNGFGPNGARSSDWGIPIIFGFVDQAKIDVFGRFLYITLIARRSRHYAGARFHKRGLNDQGYVANDVETEQIVQDAQCTGFPHPGWSGSKGTTQAGFSAHVQHRGSIPLYWGQDTSGNLPFKPPIFMNFNDPFYEATALHFDDLFNRYGAPLIILNLIKSKDKKTARESLLVPEFSQAIEYLNQFLSEEEKLKYIHFDMSLESKRPGGDVIGKLDAIAEESIMNTGFFLSGDEPFVNRLRREMGQSGVVRTNCIDCIDRTNMAQLIIGKCAFGCQLYAMGIIDEPVVPFDCDALNVLTEMYQDHGHTLAMQYGGSNLVNDLKSYRKIVEWTSHSRELIQLMKRYWRNQFNDTEKQAAMNLFLGKYVPRRDSHYIPLWDLLSDYYLHRTHPR